MAFTYKYDYLIIINIVIIPKIKKKGRKTLFPSVAKYETYK